MTLFDWTRLAPVRDGRYADAAAALAWLVGGAVVALVGPVGFVVAGVLLGVVASSVARAFASAGSFGLVAAGAIGVWALWTGAWPPLGVDPELLLGLALVVPPAVAAPVRALG